MSVRLDWTLAVRDDPDLSAGAKLLAFALTTYMKPDGECWPSVETLAAATSLSHRTVDRKRGELISRGWLVVVEQGGGRRGDGRGISNEYRAIFPAGNGVTVTGFTGSATTKNGVTVSEEGGHPDPRTRHRTRKGTRRARACANDCAARSPFERARDFLANGGSEYPEEALREELAARFDLSDDEVERLVAFVSRDDQENR